MTGIFLMVSPARFLDTRVNRKLTQNFQPNLVGIERKGKRLKEQNQVISWIKIPADYSTVIKNWQLTSGVSRFSILLEVACN
jgi:hypothetical protein